MASNNDRGFRFGGLLERREYDRGVILGIVLSSTLLGLGIIFGSGSALHFISISSFAIVAGGTLGATLVNFSPADLKYAWEAFNHVLLKKQSRVIERMRYLVALSQAVRTQGRLKVLEAEAGRSDDPFLKFAIEMTMDGQPAPEIRRILETEMRVSNERASRAVQVFETMGSYSPALGLIGTVIGLIQMLSSLENPSAIGPAMSTALVTTFYGAVAANLILLPIAGKLRNRSEEEAVVKALTIEGVLSVGNEENPMMLEQRLQSFLPAAQGA